MEREVKRYTCASDDDEIIVVVEIQTFTEFRPVAGPVQLVPGVTRWELLNGTPVNYVDAETFEIVGPDKIVRKVR